ncbi:MAG: Dabb family protein [Bacteroidales bacterium]|jgi:hypothetical protein|nr:Dabb family protein [Bacteroidales bacterium]MCU0409649.1 Dabb family protein [Bacteroidales bacterium]
MTNRIMRRKFIETSAKAVAGAGLLAASSCAPPEKATGLGKSFIHHVFFWVKQPLTDENRIKFENALKELVTIETIIDYHLGVPAPTNREVIDSSYGYSLLTVFKDKAGQDVYQVHPKHLKFIEDCQDLWEKVIVYDSVSI